MARRPERALIRTLVAAALCLAISSCVLAPVPQDAKGDSALPAVALAQVGLYRLEVALLIFYGWLLLVTPAFSGLIRARLPIEISTRGAKFAEEADQSAERDEAAIKKLEGATSALTEGLVTAHIRIEQLERASKSDSTQPAVDSKP